MCDRDSQHYLNNIMQLIQVLPAPLLMFVLFVNSQSAFALMQGPDVQALNGAISMQEVAKPIA